MRSPNGIKGGEAFGVPFRFRQLFRFFAPQVVDTVVDTRRLTQCWTHFYELDGGQTGGHNGGHAPFRAWIDPRIAQLG